MDLPPTFTIRESSHRILDPFTSAKLATLGHALALEPGMGILDLACGKGELICTWARDYAVSGIGVDVSTVYTTAARTRAGSQRARRESPVALGAALRGQRTLGPT